ncbi:MAG TPA: DedA family protein, partial [candidate division Zixibacteria bacterium]
MFEVILEPIGSWIISFISRLGYMGIIVTMGIESACIPLPSEIIMPFSGYLVSTGRFTLWGAAIAGAFGCVVGSVVAYWVGVWGGRPFIQKYGKYV